MSSNPTIIYTRTDEAPLLATYSLLPIIEAFTREAGISVETRDISLAGRIIAQFSDRLPPEKQMRDDLAELAALARSPEANIIKLPNISASIPQLVAAIRELQAKGYDLPDYPHDPQSDEEKEIRARYDKVKGSAVNPVLREGNSDRRAPQAVKAYARKYPHTMGAWSPDSKTNVACMQSGDFRANEQSVTIPAATTVRIEHEALDGTKTVLKEDLALLEGEVYDASFVSCKALVQFLREQVARAKAEGLLFSVHLKATMMKVSDPILFGHAVKVYFEDLFAKHQELLEQIGFEANNGLGDLESKLEQLPAEQKAQIQAEIQARFDAGPAVAMVNSDKGISNLHVPSDIIVDASMPAMIRDSGKMWNAAGDRQDTLAVIPSSSYAGVYQTVIDFCRENGAFDPTTMGTVPNVGLMAQAAEEYGSHDKTFEIASDGIVRTIDASGKVLTEHRVERGDIWRACQTKDAAIRDWVKLAVSRARATGAPAVFWLDEKRAHHAQLIAKVQAYLPEHDTAGLELPIMAPVEATRYSCERLKAGQDTISVTGNVLRDYLTDLFPILEVGTSAKMLSIVPLMNGGGLFETGAGGSAPKHVQQFVAEDYLRWDSLGEFFALAASFEHVGEAFDHAQAKVLAKTLDQANGRFLEENKSPARKVGGIDNRGSHFYLALYWAQALAAQDEDAALKAKFIPIAQELSEKEAVIAQELLDAQGQPVDIGGYYQPDETKASAAMRPSATFNAILERL